MKPARQVTIEERQGTFFVLYVERKRGQRYSAAQFSARDHTRESVAAWVKTQSELVLVDAA